MSEKVHIGLLLDESGSMGGNEHAVVEGSNQFIDGLREDIADKDARITLGMFDYRVGSDAVRFKMTDSPFEEIRPLTLGDYKPHGGTPLNDAVVKTIKRLEDQSKDGEKVMVVIFTDGHENMSEAKTEDVRKAIDAKEEAGWAFIYLGANQDAWSEGGARGIGRSSSFNFMSTPEGTSNTITTVGSVAALYASADRGVYDNALAGMSAATGGSITAQEDVRNYLEDDESE